MRNVMKNLALAGMLAGFLSACGAAKTPVDGGTGDVTDSGAGGGTGGGTGGGSSGTDGGTDAGTPGSSCANALSMAIGSAGVSGKIDTAGKKLFYALPVTQGDFLDIATNSNPTDKSNVLDTAVSVYDSTGATLLASADDAFPRLNTDSQLFYRAAATGTLCLKVEDFSTWAGRTPVARPADTFKLIALKLDPAGAAVTFDTESNDLISNAQSGKIKAFSSGGGGYTWLAGALDGAADVDVFKFTVPAGASQLSVFFPPNGAPPAAGTNGYGSTLARFSAKVTRLDGTVLGRVAPPSGAADKMPAKLSAVVPVGDSLLWIERPAGASAGGNDFYATVVEALSDSPLEAETTASANDTTALAEALPLTASAADPKTKSGFILGHQPAGDVDVFSFSAGVGDTVRLACAARRSGSGLVGATIEVLSSTASLQTDTETELADLYWGAGPSATKPELAITTAGTYYLKVSHASQDATNTGDYYRCGVHVKSP